MLIAAFLLVVILVMMVTLGIMFHLQFQKSEVKVNAAYDKIAPYFQKRMDIVEGLLKDFLTLNLTDKEMVGTFSEALILVDKCKAKEHTRNEVIESNVILGNLLKGLNEYCEVSSDIIVDEKRKLKLNELNCMEEDIQIASESLNVAIRTYNVYLKMFPSSLFGKLEHRKEIPVYIVK